MGVYRCNLLSLPPDEASQGALAKLQKRIEQFNAEPAPPVQPQPTNGTVLVEYQGDMHGFQLNGHTVEYGSIVEVTAEQFERLQSGYPAGWWVKA